MPLSYETVKYVSIRDARLAVLRFLLLTAIAVYVGVFELWAYGGWLAANSVTGTVRFSLLQPTVNGCDPTKNGSYCENDFTPLNRLAYCEQSSSIQYTYPGNIYPCEIYESVNAAIVTETSLVVITRATTTEQALVCGQSNNTCPRTYDNVVEGSKFYTGNSEAFTVLIDHTVSASRICSHASSSKNGEIYVCSAASLQFTGRLYSNNDKLCAEHTAYTHVRGNVLANKSPCYIAPNTTSNQHDFFSLDVLARAAEFHLDDCSANNTTPNTTSSPCETYRDSGATIQLNVIWNDFSSFLGKVEPYYSYRAVRMGTNYKQQVPFYETYRERRTLLSAHGIRIAVVLSGEFHEFEWVAFLITITTALGLLAVSTTVVDSLALYILPERERYQEAKYETADGFFDNQTLQQMVHAATATIIGPPRGDADEGQEHLDNNEYEPLNDDDDDLADGLPLLPDTAPVES